ncbi:hypothetical protein K438DRAFT_1818431 [Mycena galopus ATCC 62051]|nr:hypothetical protein K438DRAFT_1818431 [Mycena galopus ATCC 62051]
MFGLKAKVKVSSWALKPSLLAQKFKEEAKAKPVSRALRALGLRKKKSKTPLTKEYVYYEDEACAGPSEPESRPSSRPSSRIPTFLISASSARPVSRPAPSGFSQRVAVRKETSIVPEAAAVKTLAEVTSKGSSVAHLKRFTPPVNPAITPSKRSQALRLRLRLRSPPIAANSFVLPSQRPSRLRLRPRPRPNATVAIAPNERCSGTRLRPRIRSDPAAKPVLESPSSSRLRPLLPSSTFRARPACIPSPSPPVPRTARAATGSRIPVYVGRSILGVHLDAKMCRTRRASRAVRELGIQTERMVRIMADTGVQTTETARIMANAGVQTTETARIVANVAVHDRRPKHDSSDLMTELKERLARRESLGVTLPASHDTLAPVSRSPSTLKSAVLKIRQFATKGKENTAPRQEESELQCAFKSNEVAKVKSGAVGNRRALGVVDVNAAANLPVRKSKNDRIMVPPTHVQEELVPAVLSPPPSSPLSVVPLPQSTSVTRSPSSLKSAILRIRQFVKKEKEDLAPQEDGELHRVFRRREAGDRRPFGAVDINSTSGSSPDHAPSPRRRKLRRIVVPPLAEGSVPSPNPQIQSELERLRAQRKVGGGGGPAGGRGRDGHAERNSRPTVYRKDAEN